MVAGLFRAQIGFRAEFRALFAAAFAARFGGPALASVVPTLILPRSALAVGPGAVRLAMGFAGLAGGAGGAGFLRAGIAPGIIPGIASGIVPAIGAFAAGLGGGMGVAAVRLASTHGGPYNARR
jgi:hypothetical protein